MMRIIEAIEAYQRLHPESVMTLDEPVSIEYEMSCYAHALKSVNPILVFNRVAGYEGFRVVSNVFATSERISFFLGTSPESLHEILKSVVSVDGEFDSVRDDGPLKDIVQLGDQVNVFKLPVPKHFQEDAGRYITGGLVAARNPDSYSTVNLSYARIQLVEKNLLALSLHSRGHLWNYYEKSKKSGVNLPITVIIGAHPVYYVLGAARIEDEYKKASKILKPSLVAGVKNDIPVPAEAEIALECELDVNKTFNEGPFSEYTGYISGRSTNNLAFVKAILMRRDPVYLNINPSNSREHILLSSIAREAMVFPIIREHLPPGSNYSILWPIEACHYVSLTAILDPPPGLSKQLGLIQMGLNHYLKMVLICEGTLKPNFYEFLLALATSLKEGAVEMDAISNVFSNRLDPSSLPSGTSDKVIVIFKANGASYQEVRDNAGLLLKSRDSSVRFTHFKDLSDAVVNIVLDRDVELNSDDILWAMATRLRPKLGIKLVARDKIVIDCRLPGLRRPTLPDKLYRQVELKIRRVHAQR
jgi:2,5-furandicarboxylate decarboxylase 1